MALRLYFVPKVLDGDTYRPKYFTDGTIAVTPWSAMDFDDWYLIAADLSSGDHTAVNGQPDAMALPANLSGTLSAGQVTTVQTRLEAANIPANWVDTSYTWRQVLRIVCGMMKLNQRFKGGNDGAGIFQPGINLNSTVGDLSSQVRTRLTDAAVSLGLDIQGITLSTTLRAVYRNFGGQFLAIPLQIGPFTL